ncbi:MAG TPA: helix-turn-helix transcriptional regulator [Jiangellaceae bacterium]
MAETVTEADLRSLLDVLDAARTSNGNAASGLPADVLEQVTRLVPCDSVSFLHLDVGRQTVLVEQEHHADGTVGEPQQYDDPTIGLDPADDPFWRNYDTCLACSYPTVSGDVRSVTTMSDFYSEREYHSSSMYADYLGPLGIEHEAMLCLPAPTGHSRRLVFFRSGRTDFDSRDRLLLALLRPHLAEIDQELARRRNTGAALTPRQREILKLVARGDSNIEIARTLSISPGTVRKHLENVFARLGVMSRTAAVAKTFSADHSPL